VNCIALAQFVNPRRVYTAGYGYLRPDCGNIKDILALKANIVRLIAVKEKPV
jgi:hypothetical protein